MQFLSDEWLDALDDAARRRVPAADDELSGVSMTVEQVVTDGPSWRFTIDRGSLSVERVDPAGQSAGASAETETEDGVVRLISDRATAADIASGRRAALDAFIRGDLVIGGDVRPLIDHGVALTTLGDLFADLRSSTTFE